MRLRGPRLPGLGTTGLERDGGVPRSGTLEREHHGPSTLGAMPGGGIKRGVSRAGSKARADAARASCSNHIYCSCVETHVTGSKARADTARASCLNGITSTALAWKHT